MMKLLQSLSLQRWLGIVIKELIQLRRDRITFGMIVGIPIVELLIFGFAINTDPKHLPAAVVMTDPGPQARAFVAAMKNSEYFDIVGSVSSEAQAERLLAQGKVQFVVTFPVGFHRDLVRGKQPPLLVEADATDPLAAGGAVNVLNALTASGQVFTLDLPGYRPPQTGLVDVRVHKRYNPEGITAYNIVPGLIGVILTLTMVLMTALALTRERERGTYENLLATPATPLEVMTGKLMPYIAIGLVQVGLIVIGAKWIFHVPMVGSMFDFFAVVFLFIAANLVLGITISSLAKNQLQSMQMTIFIFLPSILLSGFMFPFRGMPEWAQAIGNVLPLTHFLLLVRGILLKGNGIAMLWPSLWPLLLFTAVVLGVGLKTFRRTLD